MLHYLHLPPPSSPFPSLFLVTLLCLSSLPQPVAPGFLRKGRGGPLKTPTAKFVRGRGDECTPLSTTLSRLHILPPLAPPSLPCTPSSVCPPPSHTQALSSGGPPIAQMTPLIMYLRYLAPVKTALARRWKVAGRWGRGGRVGGRGVVHGLMAIITGQAFM